MKREEINIRDPFILSLDGKYLMTGTVYIPGRKQGIYGYFSEDLKNFSEPILLFDPPEDFWGDREFWAPEIHQYQGRYYMFVSFRSNNRCRATQILSSELPEGPFRPISEEPHTPKHWPCLDGTLFIDEDGEPWMIYVREYVQTVDGEMYAQRLNRELTHLEGEPYRLFCATDAPWCVNVNKGGIPPHNNGYVTDGPFLFRMPGGGLGMLWSSFCSTGYCQAVCYSENGSLLGPWKQMERPLYEHDSGHGMLFTTLDGELLLVLHDHNSVDEKSNPVFIPVLMMNKRLEIKEEMKK